MQADVEAARGPGRVADAWARRLVLWLSLASAFVATIHAHDGHHLSVHDTVAGVIQRLRAERGPEALSKLTLADAYAALTPAEKDTLSTAHLRFRVDVPVKVALFFTSDATPFWMADRGFVRTGESAKVGDVTFEAWERSFPAGEIGLGVHTLARQTRHYFVAVRPEAAGGRVQCTDFFPARLREERLTEGQRPYTDRTEFLTTVPDGWRGQTLLRPEAAWGQDAWIVGRFRLTEHPSAADPDHVVLTWAGDPRTTQAIQWRTGPQPAKGWVRFREASAPGSAWRTARAHTRRLNTPDVVNDPVVHWHTVSLKTLKPGTSYAYEVGVRARDRREIRWTKSAEFQTAPAQEVPFAFVYMGDAQNGLDRWGLLLSNAFRARPDAAFYLMAGDLVNRGNERDDWDSLFHHAAGVYDRRSLVPVIGNHECQGGHPKLYLDFFHLPRNGPAELERERAYAFEYGNALFVVLDSNLPPAQQTAWLDRTLGRSRATWKFVTYHHPAYSSAPKRDNRAVRELWTPLFDKHRVDLALQGHDHAYLRTHPMKAQQRVARPDQGTTYVVSVSGTKMYPQEARDYTAVGFTNVATFQTLDVQIEGNRLTYRSFDAAGQLRDHFVIEK